MNLFTLSSLYFNHPLKFCCSLKTVIFYGLLPGSLILFFAYFGLLLKCSSFFISCGLVRFCRLNTNQSTSIHIIPPSDCPVGMSVGISWLLNNPWAACPRLDKTSDEQASMPCSYGLCFILDSRLLPWTPFLASLNNGAELKNWNNPVPAQVTFGQQTNVKYQIPKLNTKAN